MWDAIDLRRPGDVVMVSQAISRGWPTSPEVIERIMSQLAPAMAQVDDRHAIKIAMLALKMDAVSMLDEGRIPESLRHLVRVRRTEQRTPRRMRGGAAE